VIPRISTSLILTGLAVGAVSLWLVYLSASVREIAHILSQHASLAFAVPVIALYGLFFWLKALRWQLLLSPRYNVRTRDAFPATIVGYAGNVVLPMQLGEVARVYALGRRLQSNNAPILTSIFLERLLDLFTLAMFFELALLLSAGNFPSLRFLTCLLAAVFALGVILLAVYVFRTGETLAICRRCLSFAPAKPAKWILLQLERGTSGLEALRNPRLLAKILALSLFMWGMMVLCVHFSIAAIEVSVGFSAAIVTLVITTVGLMLPTSPGFVGTIQACFLLALTPFEVSPESAVAASVFYNVLITGPPLLLAVFYILRGFRARKSAH
jgi:uncharacterized protein (TIRG00374 family)